MQMPIREVLFQFVEHSLLVFSPTVFEFYVFRVRYQCICIFYALEGFANNRRRKIALFVKIFAVNKGGGTLFSYGIVERKDGLPNSLKTKKPRNSRALISLAEREGFEPSIRSSRIQTFQVCSFNHSDTSPELVTKIQLLRWFGKEY